MNKLLLLSALVASPALTVAQSRPSDYVVTTTGDTLRGQIRLVDRQGQRVRLYRPKMAPAEFGPAELSSYGNAAGPVGVSRSVGRTGQPRFLVPLVVGYVSLYTGKNKAREKRYYLQAPDSAQVVELERASQQLTLARMMPGCSALEFGTTAFQTRYPLTNDGLSRLVMTYNACRQPAQPSQALKKTPGSRASFGLKAGLNQTEFALTPEAVGGTATATVGYQAGGSLNVATFSQFSVQLEAMYIRMRGASEAGPAADPRRIQISYSKIQVPVLLRYTIGYGAVRPFVNAGGSLGLNFGNTSSITYRPSGTMAQQFPVKLEAYSLGLAAGTGVLLHLAHLPVLSLEARYDHGIERTGFVNYTPRYNSLRLDAGISF